MYTLTLQHQLLLREIFTFPINFEPTLQTQARAHTHTHTAIH